MLLITELVTEWNLTDYRTSYFGRSEWLVLASLSPHSPLQLNANVVHFVSPLHFGFSIRDRVGVGVWGAPWVCVCECELPIKPPSTSLRLRCLFCLFAFVLAAFTFCFLPLLPLALFSFAGTRIKRVNEQQQCVAGLSISKKKTKRRSQRSCRRRRRQRALDPFLPPRSQFSVVVVGRRWHHYTVPSSRDFQSQSQFAIVYCSKGCRHVCVFVCYQQKYQYIFIYVPNQNW